MTKLAKRLAELRGDESYYEVGKATGIHRDHIKRYELGVLTPTVEKLDKLGEYYDAKSELYYLFLDELFPELEQWQIILSWAKRHLSEAESKNGD